MPFEPLHDAPQCLRIAEIVRTILSFLTGRGRNTDLLAIGLTCRSLFEPAMDELWREQYGILHLLNVFPDKCWDKRYPNPLHALTFDYPLFPSFQTLESAPTSKDWIRFSLYANRVHSLHLPRGETPRVGEDTFSLLMKSKPTDFLLPHLRALAWPVMADLPMKYLSAFLPPHLHVLNLRRSAITEVTLNCIQNVISNIRGLSLHMAEESSTLLDGELDLIKGATSVTSFSSRNPVPARVLTHAATSTIITRLDLAFTARKHIEQLDTIKSVLFPGLQDARFKTEIYLTPELLKLTRNSPLQVLRLEYANDAVMSYDLWAILHTLKLYHDYKFRRLHILAQCRDPSLYRPSWPDGVENERNCPARLSTLSIVTNKYSDLDDADLSEITGSCPLLTKLVFRVTDRGTTLNSIQSLLNRLPSLQHLDITLDLEPQQITYNTTPLFGGKVWHQMRTVDFSHSRIDSAGELALFVVDIFPNLQEACAAYLVTYASKDTIAGKPYHKRRGVMERMLYSKYQQEGTETFDYLSRFKERGDTPCEGIDELSELVRLLQLTRRHCLNRLARN